MDGKMLLLFLGKEQCKHITVMFVLSFPLSSSLPFPSVCRWSGAGWLAKPFLKRYLKWTKRTIRLNKVDSILFAHRHTRPTDLIESKWVLQAWKRWTTIDWKVKPLIFFSLSRDNRSVCVFINTLSLFHAFHFQITRIGLVKIIKINLLNCWLIFSNEIHATEFFFQFILLNFFVNWIFCTWWTENKYKIKFAQQQQRKMSISSSHALVFQYRVSHKTLRL